MRRRFGGRRESPSDKYRDFLTVDHHVFIDKNSGEAASLPKYDPCSYKPVPGSSNFYYDAASDEEHCKNTGLAAFYVNRWENKRYEGDPSPSDINNAACAYLWTDKGEKEENWQKARDLFTQASVKSDPKDPVIEENKNNITNTLYKPSPVIQITPGFREYLRDYITKNLGKDLKVAGTEELTYAEIEELLLEAGMEVKTVSTEEFRSAVNRSIDFGNLQ